MKLKLTTSSIRSKCKPPSPDERTRTGKPVRQPTYWDTEVPGFGFIVRQPKAGASINATFVVQRDIDGPAVKVTIGRFGDWTPENARRRARELAVEMDKGVNPNAERRRRKADSVTLAEAIALHVEDMRAADRSPKSIKLIEAEVRKYLADWTNRPLADVTREDCRRRHRRITDENGPHIANRVLRHFRACYYTTARVHESLPQVPPTRAVRFNKERPRRDRIAWEDLPEWWKKVHSIENPVRRDLQLIMLITGLRSTDAKTIRWEEVDFDAGTIFRPNPKGGEDRAFTVPLAEFVLDLLRARREESRVLFGDDRGWAFPSRGRGGEVSHVAEPKEQRYVRVDGKLVKRYWLPSPHRLRHTFATAGHEAFLRELDLKVLMNHSLPASGDVTHGYVHVSVEHLRECGEKVAAFLLERALADRYASK